MTDPSRDVRTATGASHEPTTGGLGRWVKIIGIILAVVLLLVVVAMLAGGGGGEHGPSRHSSSGLDDGGAAFASNVRAEV